MKNLHSDKYWQTHDRIFQCMLELLKNKDIEKIYVVTICKKLAITRSTFYEHFLDIYDVMDQLEKQMSKRMTSVFFENGHDLHDNFKILLSFIRENKDFYHYYLENGGKLHFSEDLSCNILACKEGSAINTRWNQDREFFNYHKTFLHNGFNSMIRYWALEKDMCIEDEEYIISNFLYEFR